MSEDIWSDVDYSIIFWLYNDGYQLFNMREAGVFLFLYV